jgi:dipeptidyl aminopeptidase/acylaminoacyl peptidase
MKSALAVVALSTLLSAQKLPVTPSDFGKWETLGTAVLSPDGHWLAHQIRRTDGTYELRVSPTSQGKTKIQAFGGDPVFSSDSRFLGYPVGVSEGEEDRMKKDRRPVHLKLGILDLNTDRTTVIDDVQSFAFSDQGDFLAFRRYPPQAPRNDNAESTGRGGRGGRGGGNANAPDEPGATLTIRNLATGADVTFGAVTGYAWQERGTHIAFTIGAEGRIGNAIETFEPVAGELRVLDSAPAVYTSVAWRKDSGDLAVLRSKRDRDYDGESYTLLAWTNLAEKHMAEVYAPKRVVTARAPQWSEDGKTLFVGVADWDKRLESIRSDEEPSNVEVWHSKDVNVISEQKLRAARDRDRNALAAWHIDQTTVTLLGPNPKENIELARTGNRALALDDAAYETDGMFGRRFTDVSQVNLATGQRSRVGDRLIPPVWFSPGGKYALNFMDGDFFLYDLETGGKRAIGKDAAKDAKASFVDKENDYPVRHKPSYGIAGWTRGDKSVIVYDDTDLWELPVDGSKPRRLTDGASEQVRFRYVNPEASQRGGRGGRGGGNEEAIDLSKPVYLSMYGIWNKRTGYARLVNGQLDRAVWLDKGVRGLMKAKNADTYAYVVEAFDDSPDYFVAGADLKNAKQVTATNPFQSQYAWGKSELVEYKSPKGDRLQGALFYPANYQPGKQYPMLVHIYERESNFLHRYFPVSERTPYSEAVWSAAGYFVLMPDIVFRPREPGVSVVECVTAATRHVLGSGMIDPKRVGIVGHSWGGFGSVFTMTQTDLFAAAVAGGPLTDLVSSAGEIYWNTGVPETSHAEIGQERLEVPLWEDPQAYMRNSAIFSVNRLKGAVMLCVGDKDGASDWHQDIEFYNLARRAGKDVVMLIYPGENHSLAEKANQIDYHRRILAWFDHYLKGDEAQPWILKGVSVLDREKELKRLKKDDARPSAPSTEEKQN